MAVFYKFGLWLYFLKWTIALINYALGLAQHLQMEPEKKALLIHS